MMYAPRGLQRCAYEKCHAKHDAHLAARMLLAFLNIGRLTMKNKTYFLNTILAVVLGVILLIAVLVRTFVPFVIIPELNIPNIVAISLLTLLVEHYLSLKEKHCYVCVFLLAAVSFGIMPFAANFVTAAEILKLAVVGGGAFTLTTLLFTSMKERIASGPSKKLAPVLSAVCLYLAAQCLTGILL